MTKGIPLERPELKYRTTHLVDPLYCPACGGEIIYDTAFVEIMCIRRLEGKCTYSMSFSDNRYDKDFLWTVRGDKEKTDYYKKAELEEEIKRRREINRQLANNCIFVQRMEGEG